MHGFDGDFFFFSVLENLKYVIRALAGDRVKVETAKGMERTETLSECDAKFSFLGNF